jgi:hypothetical protein
MKKEFSKGEVLFIIDDLLKRPDMVLDIINNENSDYDTEDLFNLATEELNKIKDKRSVSGSKEKSFTYCKECECIETCMYLKECKK